MYLKTHLREFPGGPEVRIRHCHYHSWIGELKVPPRLKAQPKQQSKNYLIMQSISIKSLKTGHSRFYTTQTVNSLSSGNNATDVPTLP